MVTNPTPTISNKEQKNDYAIKSNEMKKIYTVVDLFSGIGGLSFGFEWNLNYKLVALNDIDRDCRNTYLMNFPNSNFICNDVSKIDGETFYMLNDDNNIDILLGGPPCQGFSMAGKQLFDDERNHLFQEFLRLVVEAQPKVVLIENVPEILRVFGEYVKSEVSSFFNEQGYCLTANVLNAANYGVPQTRNRAFILAIKKEVGVSPSLPIPTHNGSKNGIFNYLSKDIEPPKKVYGNEIMGKNQQTYHWLKRNGITVENFKQNTLFETDFSSPKYTPLVTVEDAIGDLPCIPEGVKEKTEYETSPKTEYQKWARSDNESLNNHNRWGHTKTMIDRIRLMPEGGNMKDLPLEYQVKGAFSQAYARLHRKGLSRTITTFIHNPGSGRFVHPTDDRAVSIREAARLQSFPDSIIFYGKYVSQERQVGNAVPPLLSNALAKHILKLLSKERVKGIGGIS